MSDLNNIILAINGLNQKEAFQKELILKSEYYYIRIICLYIKELNLAEKVLTIHLMDNRKYELLITDDTVGELVDRFDLNIIEENPRRRLRRV